jgi:hypothetical protein
MVNASAAEGTDVEESRLEPKKSIKQCRTWEIVVGKASAARS